MWSAPETELVDQRGRPSVSAPGGRLANDETTAGTQEPSRGPQGRRRRTEAPSHHRIGPRRDQGALARRPRRIDAEIQGPPMDVLRVAFDVGRDHRDTVRPPQASDEAGQVIGARDSTVDEHDPQVEAAPSDHQTGNAAPTSQVHHHAGNQRNGVDERLGVRDHLGDRSPTEHAQPLRGAERLAQRSVRRGGHDGRSGGNDDDATVGLFAL